MQNLQYIARLAFAAETYNRLVFYLLIHTRVFSLPQFDVDEGVLRRLGIVSHDLASHPLSRQAGSSPAGGGA